MRGSGLMSDVPDIWDAAKVAFESGGVQGGWAGVWGGELAHFVLHIPFVLKRQIRGAVRTLKTRQWRVIWLWVCESTVSAPVCLTLCMCMLLVQRLMSWFIVFFRSAVIFVLHSFNCVGFSSVFRLCKFQELIHCIWCMTGHSYTDPATVRDSIPHVCLCIKALSGPCRQLRHYLRKII